MKMLLIVGIVIVVLFAVFCYGVLMFIVGRMLRHPVYCNHCGRELHDNDDHWCHQRIANLKDGQRGAKWDGRSRRIFIYHQCRKCLKMKYQCTIFDRASGLPDKIMTLKTQCMGECDV